MEGNTHTHTCSIKFNTYIIKTYTAVLLHYVYICMHLPLHTFTWLSHSECANILYKHTLQCIRTCMYSVYIHQYDCIRLSGKLKGVHYTLKQI